MEPDLLGADPLPHPNPLPHPRHRKIELQSPLDLAYLRENIAEAARQKLSLHLPRHATTPGPGTGETGRKTEADDDGDGAKEAEEDDLVRARVATLVDRFLDRTFDLASHSISINGSDVAAALPASSILPSHPTGVTSTSDARTAAKPPLPPPATATLPVPVPTAPSAPAQDAEREGVHFSYEAYDPRLSSRLASLHAELERETLAVSQLRRTAPAQGARAAGEALLSIIAEEGRSNVADGLPDQDDYDAVLQLDPLPDGWRDEVAQMYERGVEDLRRLGGGVGSAGAGNALRAGREGKTVLSSLDGGGGGGGGGGSLMGTVGKVERARDVAMELE